MFGKVAADGHPKSSTLSRKDAVEVLEKRKGELPKSVMLRCRVRYFTDGAILGSAEYVRGFADLWQHERQRKYPPRINTVPGANWGTLAAIKSSRKQVFS